MTSTDKTSLKAKQVFEEPLHTSAKEQDLTAQRAFNKSETFVAVSVDNETSSEIEQGIEQVIRPKTRRPWLTTGLLGTFSGLIAWQAVDSVMVSWQNGDWLALGWAGFISLLATLGITAIGKELFKLRQLKRHFSSQERSEAMIKQQSVGQASEFCQLLASQAGIQPESPSYDRWINSINPSHSDAEILDMYDAMVVAEQDKRATKMVSTHATESAALVAISPLAVADMLLVAWRNFKMIDNLAQIYGVELGYWSRLKLFKATLINMAAAGASELAIDASMDLMSMDLAGKVSARAGQGLGVGILTARLGLKAMALLRPTPWHPERRVRLGAIRKQIVEKVAAISLK
ncbi:TIGR01620 family protein [Vibrio sp. JPW-9-11-11]|uniref:YcjF family protein n=1 Tax=Vibrio sp. JPW-9-11-11 TaxID=1416532 RepID=UPI00159315C2|nr:TIGR01620 family protein [Vibrio sp. JPW-9-11-11]NVD06833.1 TIGR01620 family protein [Vibrio sp. JPW-9-11-11]